MKRWKDVAKYCRREYGIHVDNGEEFFICPDCGEPILKEDWEDYITHLQLRCVQSNPLGSEMK